MTIPATVMAAAGRTINVRVFNPATGQWWVSLSTWTATRANATLQSLTSLDVGDPDYYRYSAAVNVPTGDYELEYVDAADNSVLLSESTIRLSTIPDMATATLQTTIAGYLDTEIAAIKTETDKIAAEVIKTAAIKAKTDNLPPDPADESLVISATDAIATLIGIGGNNLTNLGDSRLANLDAAMSSRMAAGLTAQVIWEYADRVLTESNVGATAQEVWEYVDRELTLGGSDATAANQESILMAISNLNNISVSDVFTNTVEGSVTLEQSLRLILAVMVGIANGGGTSTVAFRDLANTKNRVSANVDGSGNRISVTLDGV